MVNSLNQTTAGNAPVNVDAQDGAPSGQTALSFQVAGKTCLDTGSKIREVIELPSITPVPGTQSWFCGLACVAGELIPITDVSAWCGFENGGSAGAPKTRQGTSQRAARRSIADSASTADSRRIIVLEHGVQVAGLLVESVSGFVQVPEKLLSVGSLGTRLRVLASASVVLQSPEPLGSQSPVSKPYRVGMNSQGALLVSLQRVFVLDEFRQISIHRNALTARRPDPQELAL